MPKILTRERLVPNLHLIEIHAPEVARKCRPGQFVIVMPDEKGERIPLSIADWDAERGSVTAVFLLVGTSTRKLAALKAGDESRSSSDRSAVPPKSTRSGRSSWPPAASVSAPSGRPPGPSRPPETRSSP